MQRYTCNIELLDECPHIEPLIRDDCGGYVLHSDASAQLAAKDAEIENLTRRLALVVAEVREFRTAVDNYTGDVRVVYGQAGHIHAIVAALAATDADPVLRKMIGGGE